MPAADQLGIGMFVETLEPRLDCHGREPVIYVEQNKLAGNSSQRIVLGDKGVHNTREPGCKTLASTCDP